VRRQAHLHVTVIIGTALLSGSTAVAGSDASIPTDAAEAGGDAAPDAVLDATLDGTPEAGPDSGACRMACPATEPAEGDPCTDQGPCEYGDDPSIDCNRVYWCDRSGHFQRGAPYSDASCPSMLAPGCPPDRASVTPGETCAGPETFRCPYADGECDCDPNSRDDGASWACFPRQTLIASPQDCPARRPRLGTACPKEQLVCSYGSSFPACTYQGCDTSSCSVWFFGNVACGAPPLPLDASSDGASSDARGSDDASELRLDGSSGGAPGPRGGCGCRVVSSGGSREPWTLAILVATAFVRSKRRRG
jgi:MYXO-CTERM domain-containing protein